MTNKHFIDNLKNYAELAWASYGYFHLANKKFKNGQDKQGVYLPITLQDVLDYTYKDYTTQDHITFINPEKLNGDFTPTQAKNFFDTYDLLIHQPNTDSGFSATLFGKKKSQINQQTKEI